MLNKASGVPPYKTRCFDSVADGRIPMRVTVQLWDVAGQERFSDTHRAYFRCAHAAIISCDVTRPFTHDAMEKWISSLREYAPEAIAVMVANKADLMYDEEAFALWADHFVERHSLLCWFPVSAKTGFNVNKVVDFLARRLSERYVERMYNVIENARKAVLLLLMVKKFRPNLRTCPFTWLPGDVGAFPCSFFLFLQLQCG